MNPPVEPHVPIAEQVQETNAELAAIRQALQGVVQRLPNGNGNGNGSATAAIWRIVIGLTTAGVIAAHGFLWYLNATVAVQTEQIQNERRDVQELRDEFVKANAQRIDALEGRIRKLENGNGR